MKKNLLLETDKTRCFDETGNEINCNNTGQDAAFNKEKQSVVRFNGAGDIVEDRWTELFWSKHANLVVFPLIWKEAFDFIENTNRSKEVWQGRLAASKYKRARK